MNGFIPKSLAMKRLLIFSSITLLMALSSVKALSNEEYRNEMRTGKPIHPEHIVIHPQPLVPGDAVVKLMVPGRILSTTIYTVTGEKVHDEYHDGVTVANKYLPENLKRGEYLLKVVTEDGVGLRRIFVR